MNSKRDIFWQDKIYLQVADGESRYNYQSYPVQGSHAFKDGEDVTGRYELERRGTTSKFFDKTFALPTPAPVAEQEFQYKGWNFIEQKWEEVTKEVYDTLLDPARCAIPVAELPKEAEGKEFMTDKMKIRNLEREVEWLKDRVSYIENKLKIDG